MGEYLPRRDRNFKLISKVITLVYLCIGKFNVKKRPDNGTNSQVLFKTTKLFDLMKVLGAA